VYKGATDDLQTIAAKIFEAMGILVPALSLPEVQAKPALAATIEKINQVVFVDLC
jgi:hypothetical protein